jgi:hypothetical protein
MFSSDIAPSRTIFDSSHRSTGLGERPSELRESHDTARTTSSLHLKQSIRAIALAAALRAENYDADINRNERDRIIFVRSTVRPALFAPVFVTTMLRATYAQSAGMSFIGKTKQRRTQFVADVLIADGSHRCAEEQVARMPYASPYCPRPAQIRRVHVESRARFAVLPSRRVRSHASRLARAHHFTIPKNPWWSFVFREASE